MTTATTAQRIIRCTSENLGVARDRVTPESELVFDLGADSLNLVELCMAIEAEFSIRIDDDRFIQLKTVQHVIDHVRELMGVPA